LAATDWRLRRWRLLFLALSNAPPHFVGLKEHKKALQKCNEKCEIFADLLFVSLKSLLMLVSSPQK